MNVSLKKKTIKRKRKIARVRAKVIGHADKPRMCISKTNRHLYAQIINDKIGKSLFGISTVSKIFRDRNDGKIGSRTKKDAVILGSIVGEFVKAHNIKGLQFDKRWAKYHGVLASFADKVRELAPVF